MAMKENSTVVRHCDRERLKTLLHSSNKETLLALLENPRLTSQDVVILARRRGLPLDVFRAILDDSRWRKDYTTIKELVENPSVPRHLSMHLVKFLYRRDLAHVARNAFLAPAVRQLAIHYLQVRLEELETGEKISLARVATPSILRLLLRESDVRIIEACLQNAQTSEADLLALANRRDLSAAILRLLMRHERWGARYALRRILAYSQSLTGELAEELYPELMLQDLLEIVDSPIISLQLRLIARRALFVKISGLEVDERVELARARNRRLLDVLIHDPHPRVLGVLLGNRQLSEGSVVSLALTSRNPVNLKMLFEHPRWQDAERIQDALLENRAVPADVRCNLTGGEEPPSG
ncbi:hypothetical protein JW905_09065 [bacterium]|nr:hypothetical protein [candidate division CSSED10-310 bacterium]